uniref:ORF8 protein n=1 Tax=229E-related bat coronavirus TaxID=1739614 RepID=A0A1L2KGE6_CVH22|nr:ORF8 protein [229E-related bat coronavirus]
MRWYLPLLIVSSCTAEVILQKSSNIPVCGQKFSLYWFLKPAHDVITISVESIKVLVLKNTLLLCF